MEKQDDNERLNQFEQLLESKDSKGNRLCWIRWDQNSRYGYEIDDAREEVTWIIHEIKRLKKENAELKSFVDNFRESLEEQFKE